MHKRRLRLPFLTDNSIVTIKTMQARNPLSFVKSGSVQSPRGVGRNALPMLLGVLAMLLWQGCSTVSRPLAVTSDPPGATVTFDSRVIGTTPYSAKERFTWSEKDMPHHTVEVKLQDYSTGTRDLAYTEVVNGRSSEPVVVPFHLDLLKKDFVVDIGSTEIGASIQINGQNVGLTPLRQTFSFTRSSGSDPWSTFLVVIKKDGFTAGVAPGHAVETRGAAAVRKNAGLRQEAVPRVGSTRNFRRGDVCALAGDGSCRHGACSMHVVKKMCSRRSAKSSANQRWVARRR